MSTKALSEFLRTPVTFFHVVVFYLVPPLVELWTQTDGRSWWLLPLLPIAGIALLALAYAYQSAEKESARKSGEPQSGLE